MTRRHTAAAILLIWFVAVGWLVRREYFRPEAELLAEAAMSVSPGAAYYAVELDGHQIGFASTKVDTLTDEIVVQDWMLLRIPVLGRVQRVDARTEAILTRALRLKRFDAGIRSTAVRFDARGEVLGDSLLTVEIVTGDSRQTLRVPLARPLALPGLVPLQLAFGGELAVGRRYTLWMFDPTLLEARDVEVTVTAESTFVVPDSAAFLPELSRWVEARWDTIPAWQVRQQVGALAMEAWIDELGQIVEARTPVGFRLRRTAYELAFENFRRLDDATLVARSGGDVIGQTAIASNVTLRRETLRELTVRLEGVDLGGFDLSGDRQTLRGDTLVVRREGPAALRAAYRLPLLPSRARELRSVLRPEPLIQSDDPRIRAQARQVVGREANPARVAERLVRWVHDALEKEIVVSVPSAVDVLATRRGDCNEHTVLYVALARAVGLPARTAAGLVYVEGRFYYHAWPEVYLGDAWVAVDPTFGQFPADAAHLRFTIGGLVRQVELVRLIGHLSLEVVATEDAE